jgi:hypothetical protein
VNVGFLFLPGDLAGAGDPACGGIARPRDGLCATLRFSPDTG